ncbi:MAG: hypothetical protein ABMA64_35570 [Myxococcota bacterium]
MSSFFSKLLTRMSPAPGAPEPDPTALRDERDTFALRVQAILAAVGLGATYDPEEFALRLAGGSVSWLGNRFDEYRRAPESDRESIVLHVARGIVDAGQPSPVADDWSTARLHLRPRIRQRAHLVILGLQMEADGLDARGLLHAFVPITTDLGAEVMFDTPTNIVSIPSGKLESWSVDPHEALEVSIANLRASAPEPFRAIGDGVYAAVVGDCYDSARMLLVDEVAALPVDGEPVALPANRDTLVITGADNVGGLYRVLQIALAVLDRPRMDTLQPAVLRDGRWTDWLPPPGHPMREAYYELAVRTRGTSYAELRDLLLRRNEQQGSDLFVASYGVYRAGKSEPPWSHAIWPPVRGWLPEADLVSVLNPEDDRYIVVPRAALLSFASHLLRPVEGVHPPYLAFDGAPDRGLWLRLREHALREGTMARRADLPR